MKTKADKKQEALVRTEERKKKSALGQLVILDHRLGMGVGATKERKRLAPAACLELSDDINAMEGLKS
jgi:hypothetical protein